MLRILAYVVILALVVTGAVWLADRPGAVTAEWLGWRIETTVPVVVVLLLILAGGLTLAFHLLARLGRMPGRWTAERREGRRRKGYLALTDGLAAAAGGEVVRARKLAGRAEKLLADPSLTRFLSAQAAQLSGDAETAREHYQAMLKRPETAALGLRGLLDHALKRGDDATAIDLATRARAINAADPWLAETLFDLLLRNGRLSEATELLKDAVRRKAMGAAEAAHRRALLLNERAARAESDGAPGQALDWARQAMAADPAFTAAALRLARLQLADGKERRAATSLEQAYAANPHPALARAYAELRPGEEPLQRVRRLEKLAARRPEDVETHFMLGEASLEAKLWGQARRHLLAAAEARPSARTYGLLARLEQAQSGDNAAARAWLAKAAGAPADAIWVCRSCAATEGEWSLTCAKCGTIDSLAWAVPRPAPDAPAPAAR
jgi:HemY protein